MAPQARTHEPLSTGGKPGSRGAGVVLWLVLLAWALVGCSSREQTLLIRTIPEGADVFIYNMPKGPSPVVYRLREQAERFYLRITLEGYEPVEMMLDPEKTAATWGTSGAFISKPGKAPGQRVLIFVLEPASPLAPDY